MHEWLIVGLNGGDGIRLDRKGNMNFLRWWGIEGSRGRWGNGCCWGRTSACALCFSYCCYAAIEASSKAPSFIEHMILWRGEPANRFSKLLESFWIPCPCNPSIFFLQASIFDLICGDFEMPQTDMHLSLLHIYVWCISGLPQVWPKLMLWACKSLSVCLSLHFRSFGSFGFKTVWNSGRRMARFLEVFGFKAVWVSGGMMTRDLGYNHSSKLLASLESLDHRIFFAIFFPEA